MEIKGIIIAILKLSKITAINISNNKKTACFLCPLCKSNQDFLYKNILDNF